MNSKLYQLAKTLESQGQIDAAAENFARAGSLEDAVRVLSAKKRYGEAGRLVLKFLGLEPKEFSHLQPDGRKAALMAAICFAKGGESHEAVNLFVALKEFRRAAEILEKAGDRVGAAKIIAMEGKGPALVAKSAAIHNIGGVALSMPNAKQLEKSGKLDLALEAYIHLKAYADAGRVAEKMGRHLEAGGFYQEGQVPYEAGRAFAAGGDAQNAVDNWVRLPKVDRRYREVCQKLIRLLHGVNQMSLQCDVFLGPFITSGPQEEKDLEAFYLLAKAFAKHDLIENGKEVLQKLLKVAPNYRDAAKLLQEFSSQTRTSKEKFVAALREDESYAKSAIPELPNLPDLPDLPSLPDVPVVSGTARMPSMVAQHGQAVPLGGPERAPTTSRVRSLADLKGAEVAPAAITVGSLLADRYKLLRVLGQGGMATVYEAEDKELDEKLALKVFGGALDDESALTRFRQELKLLRQLAHRNIVQVFDIGIHNHQRYMTMELLKGHELRSYMTGVVPFDRGISFIAQACQGLQHAHEAGVVHRDIKPENLFVTDQGIVKVMDFGIAKKQNTTGVTVAGMVAGTPAYMAPEQISNFTSVGPQTDLYALGVILFEMFTGQKPFDHAELMPLLMKHLQEAPPSMRAFNPSVRIEVERVVMALLEKDAAKRTQTAAQLREQLLDLRHLVAE